MPNLDVCSSRKIEVNRKGRLIELPLVRFKSTPPNPGSPILDVSTLGYESPSNQEVLNL